MSPSPELIVPAARDATPREPGLHAVADVAARLEVTEGELHGWLGTFQWERRFDGAGHLLLDERDIGFLDLIKSLRVVDRSCASIVKLIAPDAEALPALVARAASTDPHEALKAELKNLQPPAPRRPFWRFWDHG